MDIVAIIIIILISILLVLTFYIIGLYNRLIDAKNRIEDQFTPIDLELRHKIELTNNIIEIVSKVAKHEEKIISESSQLINKYEKEKNINEKINISNNINKQLFKIFNLKETYTDLKKNKTFISLQEKIENINDKINYARTFYNDVVLDYNNLTEQFPSNLVAKVFKFKEINYYK